MKILVAHHRVQETYSISSITKFNFIYVLIVENDHPKQEEQLSDDFVVYAFQGLTVTSNENVPTSAIKHVNEAKKLFAYMQKWIKRARLFYTLRDYPLQYVNLCLDLSELYR